MGNKAFSQALSSLLHPVSVTAICALLLNDHWLRLHYPSWWTGKIGDFAWLMFAPFVGAVVLAWLIPRRLKNHQQIVGLMAFLIVGMWFGLAKTIPEVHALTVTVWEAVIGEPVSLRLDPTDLLALPGLWLGWKVWQQTKSSTVTKQHLASVVFVVSIVTTLASTDEPFYSYVNAGVTTICRDGNSLVTYLPAGGNYVPDSSRKEDAAYTLIVYTNIYASADGGQTWLLRTTVQSDGAQKAYDQQENCSKPGNHVEAMGNGPVQYRWQPAQMIERSIDGGQHWTTEFDLYQLRQEVREAYRPSSSFTWSVGTDTSPGPRSGLIDPNTGNVVLAMGWDGVLLRDNTGKWFWVSVGEYHLDELSSIGQVTNILFFELWEAVALIIPVLTTSAGYIRQSAVHVVRWVILAVGWIGWAAIALVVLPAFHHDEDFITIGLISLPLLLLGSLLSVGAMWDFLRNFRRWLLPVLGTGSAVAVLYLVPIILWTQGTIPRYTTARDVALLLTAAALIVGRAYLSPILRMTPPVLGDQKRAEHLRDTKVNSQPSDG